MKTGYLAGGITGLTYEEATGWRREIIEAYPDIRWLDPLRGTTHLAPTNGDTPLPSDFEGSEDPVWRDLQDIRQSDFILMNLMWAPRASIGTMCELGYAYNQGVPCHVALEEHGVHDHLFVRALAKSVSYSVIDAVEELLG